MNRQETFLEAINTVASINDEINNLPNAAAVIITIELLSNGQDLQISFMDDVLWTSSEDDRNFDDKTNSYEPLEPFIRKKYEELIKIIYNQRLNQQIHESRKHTGSCLAWHPECQCQTLKNMQCDKEKPCVVFIAKPL